MTYLLFAVLTYGVAIFYFGFLNEIALAWFPLVFMLTIVVFCNAPLKYSLFTAAAGGFFIDLHYLYIGPSSIFFLAILLVLWQLQNHILTHKNLKTTLLQILIASTAYFTVYRAIITFLNSKISISLLIQSKPSTIFYVLISFSVIATAHLAIQMLRTFRIFHEKKSI